MVRALISPEAEDFHGTHRSLILDIAPLVTSAAVPEHDAFTKAIPPNPITCLPTSHGMVRFEWLLNPRDATEDFEQPARWYELLKPYYAPGDYRISRADVYRWESLLATRWRDRNIFIAGDAAHQMTPHLGQGMGSGLRDAMNLAWKLAACLQGGAAEPLLDTYQSEREPHVRVYIEAAAGAANGIDVTASASTTFTRVQACRQLRDDVTRNGGSPDIPALRRIADHVSAPRLAADARTAVRDIGHTGIAPVALTLLRADCAQAGVRIPAP